MMHKDFSIVLDTEKKGSVNAPCCEPCACFLSHCLREPILQLGIAWSDWFDAQGDVN